MKEYIAYRGRKFTIEWYYDEKGKSQPLGYAEKLSASDKRKVAKLFQFMGEIGQIRGENNFRSEGYKIFAFKPQPHRFLCFFFDGQKIIVTNAFQKKQQKLPHAEKDRALRAMNDYKYRVQEGTYYEKEE